MSDVPRFFGLLAALILVAHLGGVAATRARLPSVVGELGAGIVLSAIPGPFAETLRSDRLVGACGELGVLLLMFDIGLELRTRDLRRVGWRALSVAAVGVGGSLVLVGGASRLLGGSTSAGAALFVGAALAATSMGITGRVLREFGKTQSREGRTVLAAAVIDDVMSLLLLAVVSALVGLEPGERPGRDVGWILLKVVVFFALALSIGRLLLPRLYALLAPLASDGALLVFGLATCLGYGFAASLAGLSPVIGAFCAGLVIQPEDYRPLVRRQDEGLEDLMGPLLAFFVPMFFALAGLRVDVAALLDPRALLLTLVFFVAAIVGKVSAGLAAGPGVSKLVVGVSMVPRGEVTLIFATTGMALVGPQGPLVSKATFNAIVATVILTALLPPMVLRRLFRRPPAEEVSS